MDVCPKILDWALEPNSTVTIHPQFLAEYTYWTDKKLVDFSRDKGNPVKTHNDVTRKQVLKDWFRMNTVSRTVNEVKTTASKPTKSKTRCFTNCSCLTTCSCFTKCSCSL